MSHIKFYHIKEDYVNYLLPCAPHLFYNRREGGRQERKYIGIVLRIGCMDYFAPLSSFKAKHAGMRDSLDLIKVKSYAVINLNNMFPVPEGQYEYVDIARVEDEKYRDLLRAEYRYIKRVQEKIRRSALLLYRKKVGGEKSAVAARCSDFRKLEELCRRYRPGGSTEKISQGSVGPASVREDSRPPVHGKGDHSRNQLRCPEGVPHAGGTYEPAQDKGGRKDDHNVPAQGDDEGGKAHADALQGP